MVEYAYTTVPGKIKSLLSKVRSVGIPPKVTTAWLKSIGFTSSNDSTLIGVLKFVGFIDGSNIPTSTWTSYRGGNHRAALGEAVRTGYADLFAVYPDANVRPATELSHVFSTSSSGGAQVISKTVTTFKALVDEAEFSTANPPTETTMLAGPLHVPPHNQRKSDTQSSRALKSISTYKFIFLPNQRRSKSTLFSNLWRSICTGGKAMNNERRP
jgi:hypothetical protein